MADDQVLRSEIGPDTTVVGEIEAREDVSLFGTLEGRITSTHAVVIEEGGEARALIEASVVVVAGVVIGDLKARDRVEITSTGRVVGTIETPRLILEEGGAVKGRIVMDGSRAASAAVPAVPVRTAARPAATSTSSARKGPAAPATPARGVREPVRTSATTASASRSRPAPQAGARVSAARHAPVATSPAMPVDAEESVEAT
jgi:cytoskeletal protein CcmA (bactofilin family)